MTVTISQTHFVDADGVRKIVADHYRQMGMSFAPSYVSFQIIQGGGSGFSSSRTRLGDTTIHVPPAIRRPGLPSAMTLKPEDVQAILAERLTSVLGFDVTPGSVTIDVSEGGGSGFSASSASLRGATVRSTISLD